MRPWTVSDNISLAALCILLGAALYSVYAPVPPRPVLDAAVGQKVVIEGLVAADPDVRAQATYLTVDTPHGRVQIRTDPYRVRIAYGDTVRVTGKLKKPESFETNTGTIFDYPHYLLVRGIQHTMSAAAVEVLDRGGGSRTLAFLYSIKHQFLRGIESAFPKNEAALLAGILIGEKRGLGDELTSEFRNAGLVHIIVLSGYNIALLIRYALRIAQALLPRAAAYSVAGIIAILFMLATGASETAVRATLMALVVLLAQALHRPAAALRILLMVAAVMAAFNPYLVLYDLSFQLSVLATLGLIVFSKPIESRLAFVTTRFNMREVVATTIAVELTVLPLLIYSIGQVSIVSILSNILVLGAIPFVMFTGFFATLGALVSTTLIFPLTYVCYLALAYIILVAQLLGSLPFAVITF